MPTAAVEHHRSAQSHALGAAGAIVVFGVTWALAAVASYGGLLLGLVEEQPDPAVFLLRLRQAAHWQLPLVAVVGVGLYGFHVLWTRGGFAHPALRLATFVRGVVYVVPFIPVLFGLLPLAMLLYMVAASLEKWLRWWDDYLEQEQFVLFDNYYPIRYPARPDTHTPYINIEMPSVSQ